MTTHIKRKFLRPNEARWLVEHIGPQEYYLPKNKRPLIGGQGWSYNHLSHDDYYIDIKDDEMATLFLLTFGG